MSAVTLSAITNTGNVYSFCNFLWAGKSVFNGLANFGHPSALKASMNLSLIASKSSSSAGFAAQISDGDFLFAVGTAENICV